MLGHEMSCCSVAMGCCSVAQSQGLVRRDIERAKVQCQVRSLIPYEQYEGMAHEAQ
jgi:hypothetical protein